jgi:hypothetical protein
MEIHSFGTEHAFIHGMVFISLHAQLSLPVFMHYDPATYTAIAAGCLK